MGRLSRSLAIDLFHRGFGFVVLEGSEQLLDWGTANAEDILASLGRLIGHYRPSVLVLAGPLDWRRGERTRINTELLVAEAIRLDTPVQFVSRSAVLAEFSSSGKTKHEIALALSRQFPELEPRLPRKRKPWMSEDERMNIFDALALAVTHMAPGHRSS